MPVPAEVEQEFAAELEREAFAWAEAAEGELPGEPTTEGAKDDSAVLESAPALAVPDERQVEGYACGAACVVAVCRFFGKEPDRQGDALRQLGTSPRDGTDPEHIIAVLQDHGLETVALSGMGMDEVEYFLGRGMPLIACVQAWGAPEEVAALESGHYVVLCGTSDEGLTVMDPARFDPAEPAEEYGGRSLGGQRVLVPREEFLRRWVDQDSENNVYERYGIAVRGSP